MIKQSQEDLSARPFVFEKLINFFYILLCKFFYNINVLLLLILSFYNFFFLGVNLRLLLFIIVFLHIIHTKNIISRLVSRKQKAMHAHLFATGLPSI